jgi:hypothetical protein
MGIDMLLIIDWCFFLKVHPSFFSLNAYHPFLKLERIFMLIVLKAKKKGVEIGESLIY